MFRSAPTQLRTSLAARLKAFVRGVVRAVGQRVRPAASDATCFDPVPPSASRIVGEWLRARLTAIETATARIEAGMRRRVTPNASHITAQRRAPDAPAGAPRADRLAPRFGWVCRWAPETEWGGAAVCELLEGPRLRSLFMAAPDRMARLWSPLLNALGQIRPEWFPQLAHRARTRRDAMAPPVCGQTRPRFRAELARVRRPTARRPAAVATKSPPSCVDDATAAAALNLTESSAAAGNDSKPFRIRRGLPGLRPFRHAPRQFTIILNLKRM
jgi:hypothetical protein